MLPKIISAVGAALTPEEIEAAIRVVSTRENQRAGIFRILDELTGVLVEFHVYKNTAYTTPGGVIDYVGAAMPNPVPYRGVSIGNPSFVVESGTYTAWDVQTSTFEPLLHIETVTAPPFGSPTYYVEYYSVASQFFEDSVWSGGESIWLLTRISSEHLGGYLSDYYFSKVQPFKYAVPEDCIYPVPSDTPPSYSIIATFNVEADTPAWDSYWRAGVSVFKARRKAWFKKNSDTALDQLKEGTFVLPASWDYQIKRQCPVSNNTRRPIIISATFVGAITLPFGTLGGAVGSTSSESSTRTTTLTYTTPVIQPDGSTVNEVRTQVIVGTLLKVRTRVVENFTISEQRTYLSWYVSSGTSVPPDVTAAIALRIQHQFLTDKSNNGWGLFWSGAVTVGTPYFSDSVFGAPSNLIFYAAGNLTPPYINTLVGTAPPFLLTYHKDVPPEYTAPIPPATSTGSTVFNDSAMYGVTEVTLIPFSLVKNGESLGMFPDASDITGATQFEYYGKAAYRFDWQTGQLVFKRWAPVTNSSGAEVDSLIANLPAGVALPTYNCVVRYTGLQWEDIQVAAKTAKSDRAAGNGDKILAEILSYIK